MFVYNSVWFSSDRALVCICLQKDGSWMTVSKYEILNIILHEGFKKLVPMSHIEYFLKNSHEIW